MIAEVLEALQARLHAVTTSDGGDLPAVAPDPEIEDLIASALSELARISPSDPRGGIAPMLGNGVLQELLRQRRQQLTGSGTSTAEALLDRRR